MKMHIDIDTKTFIRFWLVVIGFGLVALAIYTALPALIIVGASFFLAIALNPPVSKIAKLLPSKSRVISTALAYIVVVVALGLIVLLVVPPIVEQTLKFAQTVPSLVDSASKQYSVVNNFVNNYNLQSQLNDIVASIKNSSTQFASSIGSGLIAGIGSIVSVVTTSIIVLVLTFLMLAEGPMWMKRLWSLYNNQKKMEYHRATVHRMYTVVTGYVAGQLTVSAIAGLLAGLVVFILSMTLGVPSNLAIPTVAVIFVMSLIPFFGSIIGTIFMCLIIAINSPTAAIIFLGYFLLYQQIEANYLSPKIQSKRLDLTPLSILVSIVIGMVLFGIAGAIISIPIAGCINILVDNYFIKSKDKAQIKIEPVI